MYRIFLPSVEVGVCWTRPWQIKMKTGTSLLFSAPPTTSRQQRQPDQELHDDHLFLTAGRLSSVVRRLPSVNHHLPSSTTFLLPSLSHTPDE